MANGKTNNGSSSASASIGRGSTIFAQGSPTSSRGTISARSRFFSRAKAATGNSLALFNFLTQLPVPGAHARHGHIGSAAVPVFLAGSKRTCSPSRASSSMNTSGASTARARSTKSTRLRTSTSRERSCARAPNCRAKSFSAWAGGSYDRRAAEGQDLWPRRGYRRAQQDRRGRHGRRRVDDLTRDKRSPGKEAFHGATSCLRCKWQTATDDGHLWINDHRGEWFWGGAGCQRRSPARGQQGFFEHNWDRPPGRSKSAEGEAGPVR